MAKLNKDDLTHLIDEATNLRTTKFEGMGLEGIEKDNEEQGGEALAEEFEQEQASAASGGD